MLLAGGFAPAYPSTGLASRSWPACAPRCAGCSPRTSRTRRADRPLVGDGRRERRGGRADRRLRPGAARPPINVLRLSLHPDGMAPRIINLAAVARAPAQPAAPPRRGAGRPAAPRAGRRAGRLPGRRGPLGVRVRRGAAAALPGPAARSCRSSASPRWSAPRPTSLSRNSRSRRSTRPTRPRPPRCQAPPLVASRPRECPRLCCRGKRRRTGAPPRREPPGGPARAPAGLADRGVPGVLRAAPRDFLAVATPGAGKTTFALSVAAELLGRRMVDAVTVVAPTEHLKLQWAEAAARVGIPLDPTYSATRRAGPRPDFAASRSPTPGSRRTRRCTGSRTRAADPGHPRRDPPRRRRAVLGRRGPGGVRAGGPPAGADRHAVPLRHQPDPVRHLRAGPDGSRRARARLRLRLRPGAGRRRRPAGDLPGLLRRDALADPGR